MTVVTCNDTLYDSRNMDPFSTLGLTVKLDKIAKYVCFCETHNKLRLFIFQHCLLLPLDYGSHPQHWLLLDRVVQQIVLQGEGQEDPDVSHVPGVLTIQIIQSKSQGMKSPGCKKTGIKHKDATFFLSLMFLDFSFMKLYDNDFEWKLILSTARFLYI